jgi:hypothetical protein
MKGTRKKEKNEDNSKRKGTMACGSKGGDRRGIGLGVGVGVGVGVDSIY